MIPRKMELFSKWLILLPPLEPIFGTMTWSPWSQLAFTMLLKTSLKLIQLQPTSQWKQVQKLEFTSSRHHLAQLVDIMTSLALPVFLVLLDVLNV